MTYLFREMRWLITTKPGFPVTGVLEVREKRTHKSKERLRTYVVSEQKPPALSRNSRHFRYSKGLWKEVYYITVPIDHLGYRHCTCEGFRHHSQCVHVETLQQLNRKGLLG